VEWWPKPKRIPIAESAVEEFFAEYFANPSRPVLATGMSMHHRAALRVLGDQGRIVHTPKGWVVGVPAGQDEPRG
jgi:hypothetical protein